MTRILYPILGLLVLVATVAQVRANRAPVHAKPGLQVDAKDLLVVLQ